MSNIIDLMEWRKRKCMEALMLQIGLPGYCDECGEGIEDLLMAEAEFDDIDEPLLAILHEEAIPVPPHGPAVILTFAPRDQRQMRSRRTARKK